jgi:RNA polymerase sigma-70 factor (ECF subfamily)
VSASREPAARSPEPEAAACPADARAAGADWDFDRIYDEQFEFVWRSLRLLGVPPEGLEDAAQDCFSGVSRQIGRFEGRSALRTWLFAIVQRVAANHRRRVRRKLEPLQPLDDGFESEAPNAQAHVEAAEVVEVIQRFCDGLEGDVRAVFVLALLEGMPAPEVAQAVGISVNTVYSRVHMLRDGLRRALSPRAGGRG